jgi:hypothetical protein
LSAAEQAARVCAYLMPERMLALLPAFPDFRPQKTEQLRQELS